MMSASAPCLKFEEKSAASLSTYLVAANADCSGTDSISDAVADLAINDLGPRDLYKILASSSETPLLFAWWPTARAWCHDELAERCTRCLPGVRPKKDIVALPRLPEVEELWCAWAEQHGMDAWQAVWFDPFPQCLFADSESALTAPVVVFEEVIAGLQSRTLLEGFLFYPMYLTAEMLQVCQRFGLHAIGDAADHSICQLSSAKAWLHPHINPQKRGPSLRDALSTKVDGAPVARGPWGYIASSGEELVEAMRTLLGELPLGARLVLKPSWASGGDGIIIDVTEQHLSAFAFPLGGHHTAILEEFVEGNGESPTLYMIGSEPCGLLADQILSEGGVVNDGNRWPSPSASEALTQTCIAAAQEINKVWGLTNQWGLDFVISRTGVPIIVDLNMGRPNGNFSVRLWESRFCQNLYLHTSSWCPPAGVGAEVFFRALRDCGLAWDPVALQGVVVYQHLPGKSSAYVVASANSWETVDILLGRLHSLMEQMNSTATQ